MPNARRNGAAADADTESENGYRVGLQASHRGEHTALQTLNTALEMSLARGDAKGAALASAALLIGGQVRSNYRRFPEHIARLAIVRDRNFSWLDRDEELVALAGLLAGLLFFAPADPFLEPCVERIMTLLELNLDVNARFAAGRLVMYYSEPREMRALGQRVYSLLRPSMEREDLTPHRLGHWLVSWARVARYAKEPQQAQQAEQQARRLAEDHKLQDVLFWLAVIDVDRSLPERNLTQAERGLVAAGTTFGGSSREEEVGGHYWSSRMKADSDRAIGSVVYKGVGNFDFDLPLSKPKVNEVSEGGLSQDGSSNVTAPTPTEQAVTAAYRAVHDAALKKNLKGLLAALGFEATQVAAIRGLDGIDADLMVYSDRFLTPGVPGEFNAIAGIATVRGEGMNSKGKKFTSYYHFATCGDHLVLVGIGENPM